VFVGVIVLIVLAMTLYSLVLLAETRLLSWQSWRQDAV
jgi:ABC-type nitrate/sulfonate/bicarbonate transport system permease component